MVAAWIFVLSPPRERPKAWSPPFFLVLLPRAGGLVPLWSPSTDDGLGRSIRTEAAAKAGAILPALPSVEIACKLRASSPTPVREPSLQALLRELRERLRIDGVVIHWFRYAADTDANAAACVEAQFTDNPKITTGAGDHFNAGFCLGRLLRGNLHTNIRLSIATSGYYVRQGQSPTVPELIEFVKALS